MYRWNILAFVAIALSIQASTVKAEACRQAEQQGLLCFTPINGSPEIRSSEPPASGIQALASGTKALASGTQLPASGTKAPASSAEFWGSTTSDTARPGGQDRPLPENAGITSHTDAWGKTTYYNPHGLAIGSSTRDIAGNVHYRDQNGTEVDRLW